VVVAAAVDVPFCSTWLFSVLKQAASLEFVLRSSLEKTACNVCRGDTPLPSGPRFAPFSGVEKFQRVFLFQTTSGSETAANGRYITVSEVKRLQIDNGFM
jgi:hypothetical protein